MNRMLSTCFKVKGFCQVRSTSKMAIQRSSTSVPGSIGSLTWRNANGIFDSILGNGCQAHSNLTWSPCFTSYTPSTRRHPSSNGAITMWLTQTITWERYASRGRPACSNPRSAAKEWLRSMGACSPCARTLPDTFYRSNGSLEEFAVKQTTASSSNFPTVLLRLSWLTLWKISLKVPFLLQQLARG